MFFVNSPSTPRSFTPTLLHSSSTRDRTLDLKNSKRRPFSLFCFRFLYFPATKFAALAHQDLPFVEYTREFCGLANFATLDDATLNSLFWIGVNCHRPVDLPDTTGLSWREGILRCASGPDPEPAVNQGRRPFLSQGHRPLRSQACRPLYSQALSRQQLYPSPLTKKGI